jgi:hypothetical protein
MVNPNMPNVPGLGAMTDSLEFVKNLWGNMGIPGAGLPASGMPMSGMIMPTLSVDEIRKKITDMRTVEAWLELNMSMLRASIQALEVQATTIATLQTMSDALSATVKASTVGAGSAMQQPAEAPASEAPKAAAPGATSEEQTAAAAAAFTAPLVNATAWWNMLQDQFKQAVANAMTAEAAKGNGHDHSASRPESDTSEAETASRPARNRKSPSK